jgi:hypothetical protein
MDASKMKNRPKGSRKLKKDTAIHRYCIRLNDEENTRFTTQFLQSGMKEKTGFIKHLLFGTVLKTVKIDRAAMDYCIRLTTFYAQFQAIGNNYNQTVKAIKTNFSEKRALSLLYQLEKTTVDLIVLSKKIIALTSEFESKHLSNND